MAEDKDDWLQKFICKPQIIARDGYKQTINEQAAKISKLTVERIDQDKVINELNLIIKESNPDGLKQQLAAQTAQISDLNSKLAKITTDFSSLQKEALNTFNHSREFWQVGADTQAKLISYENKYSKILITYPARYVGNNTNNGVEMDVKPFVDCGINDQGLASWAAEHNCRLKDVQKDYPAKSIEACLEIVATRVQARLANPYGLDSSRWGRSEFWEYATEVFYGSTQKNLSFDCDSWANLKHVLRRICGVPDEMMRMVTGTTFTDEGHATNSMYFPSRGFFVHLNSTSRGTDNDDIGQFKRMGDSSEGLNIKIPWWSTCAKFSHMQMITDAQATEARRRSQWRATKGKVEHQNRLMFKTKFYDPLTGERILWTDQNKQAQSQ